MDCNRLLTIIGLILSILGTISVSFIAQHGIVKKNQKVEAPDYMWSVCGWVLMILGFVFQLIGQFL